MGAGGSTARARNPQQCVVHTGDTPGLKFACLENYLADGTALEPMQLQPSTLPAFSATEASCLTGDGARSLWTLAKLTTDLAALGKNSSH
jgi:hypothetical protein